MATATAITAGVGLASGAAKFFEGRKMQREAESKIAQFQWQDLANPYKDLQVSTMGADLQKEEAARMSATSMDAIRGGGLRAIAGNVAGVQAQNNLINQQIGANLDQQQQQINQMTAGQEVANQNIIEQRQANELAGYGQMMNVGMGMKYGGLTDIANAAGAAGQAAGAFGGSTPKVSPKVSTVGGGLTAQGATQLSGAATPSGGNVPNLFTGIAGIRPLAGAYTAPVIPNLPFNQ